MTSGRRTPVAAALILTAVALPCAAWFWVGSRDAERQARQILERPEAEGRAQSGRLADQLAVRLEALRQVESRRPFFHYQSQFHDPHSDCECSSVTVSPLSHGPSDPLIWTYFQIDPLGQLTLPTLNEVLHRERGASWLSEQADILEKLIPAAGSLLAVAPESQNPADTRRETVDEASWILNMELCGIRTDPLAVPLTARESEVEPAVREGHGSVDVTVGPFAWHTLEVGGEPSLVALRGVSSPLGRFSQGFVVDAVDAGRTFPAGAAWHAGPPSDPTDAPVALGGRVWHVSVVTDASAAAGRAAEVTSRFRTLFWMGTLAAVLAGLAVVLLVGQAERLARQRARFAAAAAHELRTPLTGMRMYGEMLAHSLGDTEKTRRYADHIAREADRLGRVVSNVMGYARLERGEMHLHRTEGDLAKLVREGLAGIEPVAAAAGSEIGFRVTGALPTVRFDRDAVSQILQNLVDNALKHARTAGKNAIMVAVAPVPGGVELSVTDRGPGVPPRARGRLFQPFYRGDVSGDTPGLGLGLTLVRALAEAHGGSVGFREAAGGGSVFAVFLPAQAVPAVESAAGRPASASAVGRTVVTTPGAG